MFLKTKFLIVIAFVLGGLSLSGQSFMYSYIDPCTGNINTLMYDMSSPLIVSYYGETRSFTPLELQNGTFDAWLNQVYANYQASPCQGVLAQTTATSSTNLTTNVVQAVLNLNTIVSIGSIDLDIGSTTNTGTNEINDNNNDNSQNNSNSTTSGTSGNSNSGSQSGSNSGSTSSGSNSGGSNGSNGGGNSSGEGGSGNSGDSGSGNGGNSSGGTNSGSEKSGTGNRSNGEGGVQGNEKEGTPSQEEITEVKEDQQKTDAQQTSKSTSKAKAQVQKPAILVTGDIVGLQKTDDKSNDARGTVSFTRVKGDGTASLGLSADYMVNARIANVTAMRSWIGRDEKGNKHINLLSVGVSIQPSGWSNTDMFIRVHSMKKLTAIYGAAGSFGYLYDEPITSTLVIGGFMYKGLVVRKIEATVIAAGVYSPYTKYYTETWWLNRPIIIPFFNLNYKVTKTFGMGLTGGGTYQAGQNVLNYQVLFGAKLIL